MNDRTPPEKECDAPATEGPCSGMGFLWNAYGERACGAHQRWLARVRKAKQVAA